MEAIAATNGWLPRLAESLYCEDIMRCRGNFLRTLLAASLTLMVVTTASAEKRVALVVGNDKYANLPTLQKAGNDAASVGDALERLGFDVVRGRDLGRQGMVD